MSRPRRSIWALSWDDARKRPLRRHDSLSGKAELLDRGVHWFVRALEDLGATTRHSCDGHGKANDWYITFHAPYELAARIALWSCEWFDVVLSAHPLRPDLIWSLRVAGWRLDRDTPGCVPWEEIYRRAGQDMLETAQRETAAAWTSGHAAGAAR